MNWTGTSSFYLFPLPSHSYIVCKLLRCLRNDVSSYFVLLRMRTMFNTPVLLSVLHHTSLQHLTHSLITKERGGRKWCHKDVMESVYRIVLGLSIPFSHELPELLCQWRVTPPWAGFDLLIVQHLMLLLHFYWPSTFIFRTLFLFLGLSM